MDQTDEQRELSCFDKAKEKGEPTFTLRSQDLTAPMTVEFWITLQMEVKQAMDDGMTGPEAIEHVRREHRIPHWTRFMGEEAGDKLHGAARIGKAMEEFPNRRLAD